MKDEDPAHSPAAAVERTRFHENDAIDLVAAIGLTSTRLNPAAKKFAYFADDERFVVVAGSQEKKRG